MSPILKPYGPQLGAKLLPNGCMLAPSWTDVRAKWVQVGRQLGFWWPKLTHVQPMFWPCQIEMMHLDDFGPIAKCANFHSGPVRIRNYHASAPSVQADVLGV